MNTHKIYFILIVVLCYFQGFAQDKVNDTKQASSDEAPIDSSRQRDMGDVLRKLFHKPPAPDAKASRNLNFSVIPTVGYTLSTGFAVDITANVAFYTSQNHKENLSAIQSDLAYDTKAQDIFITRSEIWFPDNQYKFVSDIRWEKFPTDTYGLGTLTTSRDLNHIVFNYVRVYGTLYKRLANDFYGGAGYNLDYHYKITEKGTEDGTLSDFKKYGQTTTSTSSGINLSLLFDNRRNPINSLNGEYANLTYRRNFSFLGSNSDWRSLWLDLRKYVRVAPGTNNNVLAFWGMAWYSFGKTPYLDLPATGTDMYSNSGRGFPEGRFRGKDMLYLESEFRYGITHNGLLGGVLFVNGESFSEPTNNTFKRIAPGYGAGLRIKANRHSNTNVCLDYAFGTNGSRGVFVNLGEVF